MRNNRILTMILTIYLVGIISSFILVRPTKLNISSSEITIISIVKTFCLNYWYIFIVWILGLSLIGFIINIFIVYFRGFVFGLLILFLIKTNLKYLLVISVIEIILFIPIFIFLSYSSIVISFSSFRKVKIPLQNYDKILVIATILIFIYSILLEIVGGLYA